MAGGSVASVLRTPRWIGLTVLAVLVLAGCVVGGMWQWTRTQDILAAERAVLADPVAVAEVAPVGEPLPAESIGRPVIASGRYDRASQRYVASRELDGRPGVWVVAPLTLADGTVVAVLRGWVADVDEAADAPPTGEVRVDGVLQPGETFYRSAPVRPDGLLLTISDEALREVWGGDLRSGVVVLESERPRPAAAPVPVPPTVRSADVSFPLQNFFYAIQWWVFAAFAVFVWVRWLRLDVRAAQEAETGRVAAGG